MYGKRAQKPCLNFCYTREEMLLIREFKSSRTRPTILSDDFNNDDGLFSPDKWLQHQWECEGVESRTLKKKKISGLNRTENVISTHDLEQTVLSPQRRGFSCGCRAPSPKLNEDEKSNIKIRWRHGNLNNGVDFKPSFQKNALEQTRNRSNNSAAWRNNHNHPQTEKIFYDKTNRNRNYEEKLEKMPEWLEEGPSSMTEIIELKGFEDEVKEKKTKKRKTKELLFKSGNCSSNSASTGTNGEELQSLHLISKSDNKNNRQRNSRSNSRNFSSRPPSREMMELLEKSLEHKKIETVAKIIDENQKNILDHQISIKNSFKKGNENSSVSGSMSTLLTNNEEKKSMINSTTVFDHNKANSLAYLNLPLNNVEEKNLTSFFVPESPLSSNQSKNIPNSDAEFAAFLGILDVDPSTIKPDPILNSVNQPSSSRLSRFFCKNSAVLHSNEQSKEDLMRSNLNTQNSQQHRAIIGQNSTNDLDYKKNNNQSNVLPIALKELFAAASPKSHATNDLNGGMTVEELERYLTLKFHHSTNLDEVNQVQKSPFSPLFDSENLPLFYQQRFLQNANYSLNSGKNNNLEFPKNNSINDLTSGICISNGVLSNYQVFATMQQQQKYNYFNSENQNQMLQQITQKNTSMLQKLFSNATTKLTNEINGGMTVQELEREIAQKAITGSRGNNSYNNNNNNNNNNINNNSNNNNSNNNIINNSMNNNSNINNNANSTLPLQLQFLSQQPINVLPNRQSNNDYVGLSCSGQTPVPPLTLICGNIANELTPQQQNQLMEQFVSARAFLEHLHHQNPQQVLLHMAHLQQSMVLQCRLLVASNAIPPDLNQMRAAGTQLVQMGHDPTVVATYLARNASTAAINLAGCNFSNATISTSSLQQNNVTINQQQFANNNNEKETNVHLLNSFDQPEIESSTIVSMTANKSSSNVNAAAFMPTSVLRQMTKVPGNNGSGSTSVIGEIDSQAAQSSSIITQKAAVVFDNANIVTATNNPQFRLQNSMFDAASFALDQQQLNLAITRGDLASAQAIRARMVAQVQALAGVPPLQDSLKIGTLR